MWRAAVICSCFVSMACGGLVYSPGYANVRYQGLSEDKTETDSQDRKEEVTTLPTFCSVNPTPAVDTETVTDPNSETVNATTVNRGPKKLHERIELADEIEPTQEPDLEPSDPPVKEEQGVYYIIHPNGLLQRIGFTTKDDLGKMEYQANFNYKDVEPIADPIYTYDPNTLVFQTLK